MKNVLTIVLISVTLATWGQSDTLSQKQQQKIDKKAERTAKKAQKLEEGKLLLSPLILPGYTPELQFAIGGGGLLSWKNNKSDKNLPRSNMAVGLSFSSTGAIVLNFRPITYWASDNFRLNGDIWYKDMPDHYWGIGYQKGYETPKTDSTTAYQRLWYQFRGDALFRLKGNLFGGLTFDINYTKGSDASEGVINDPNYFQYNDKPLNIGIGPIIRYDSRDVPVNACKGFYLNAQALFYGSYLGGDNTYQMILLDYRQYKNISNQKGRTLAWQIATRMTFGDVPYSEMSQLGTPFDLRGYTWGRYRDKCMFFWIAEYRHMFSKADGTLSKSGFVAWIGAGTIYDIEKADTGNNAETNKWLPNLGVGYRLELQPRLNMRIDFGIGRETTGFYFNMNEAF